jgi:hypothetical protein
MDIIQGLRHERTYLSIRRTYRVHLVVVYHKAPLVTGAFRSVLQLLDSDVHQVWRGSDRNCRAQDLTPRAIAVHWLCAQWGCIHLVVFLLRET